MATQKIKLKHWIGATTIITGLFSLYAFLYLKGYFDTNLQTAERGQRSLQKNVQAKSAAQENPVGAATAELDRFVRVNRVYGPCTVLRVIDGDTLEVLVPVWPTVSIRSRVRVWGCDTPERKQITLERWQKATEYTRVWVNRHHEIILEYKGTDSLGRELCVVYGLDEGGQQQSLHQNLIDAGHAIKRESK